MKKRNYALVCAAVAGGLALLIGIGCETTSPDEMGVTISVSPNVRRLPVGGQVTLSASGWRAYRWALNSALGYLSSMTGEHVVYTAIAAGTQTIIASPIGVNSSTNSTTIAAGSVTFNQYDETDEATSSGNSSTLPGTGSEPSTNTTSNSTSTNSP